MIIGVLWALIGYVLCEVTNRGKVTTTVATAAAGALGVGAKAAQGAGAAVPEAAVIAIGVIAALMVVFLAVLVAGGRRPRRHGSAAMASTRQVLYHEGRNRPIHQGEARPDRTRGGVL